MFYLHFPDQVYRQYIVPELALTFNNNKYKRVDIISDILTEEKNKQENTN